MSTVVKNPSKKSTPKKSARKSSTISKKRNSIFESKYTIRDANSNWIEPSRWMTDDPEIRKLSLDQVTLLGSHDAGMSVNNGSTVPDGNILTQVYDIGQQLNLGARYFDIRPTSVPGGRIFCGHFTGILGGIGQSIDEIVNQINDFCADKKELIILNINHDLHIDKFPEIPATKDFEPQDWDILSKELGRIQYLCEYNDNVMGDDISLRKTIGELTAEKSAVVVIDRRGKLCGNFCKDELFKTYNKYSDTDDCDDMIVDQFKKLKEYGNTQDQLFLLSWTLTQQINSLCEPIIELARKANKRLSEIISKADSLSTYPHVVYIDCIEDCKGYDVIHQINDLRKTNRMDLNIECNPESGKPICTVSGSFNCVINKLTVETFEIDGDKLKKAVGKYKGRIPNDVFLHSPTPWNDLYKTYGWEEVKLNFKAYTPEILNFESNRNCIVQKKITNNGSSKKAFDVVFSESVVDKILFNVSNQEESSVGFDAYKGFENIFYFNLLSKFPMLSIDEGHPTLREYEYIIEGPRDSINANILCKGSVELAPGQSVYARLYVDFVKAYVNIRINRYLSGMVAVNYDPVFEGHHFYGIPIENILDYNGISNKRPFNKYFRLEYIANPEIQFGD